MNGFTDSDQQLHQQIQSLINFQQMPFWPPPPPIRQWTRTPYGRNFRYDSRRSQAFVLMSYNILAQSLLTKHAYLYDRNRPEYLDWSHRLRCICDEILTNRPAILCLQEVQNAHLHEIENALRSLNYTKPMYKQRTGRDYDDGCAIFYNSDLFELLDYHCVEYYQPNVKMLDRCNVAIVAKFASKRLKNIQFVVATTHLLYNPRRDDIRTAQLQVLLAELDRMSAHTETHEPLPIILTGDFNCLPFSPPFRLIHEGHINASNLPIKLGIMDDCQHINVAVHKNRQNTSLFHSSKVEADCDTENSDESEEQAKCTMKYVQECGMPYNTGSLWHYLNLMPTLMSSDMASTHQGKWIMVDFIFYTKYLRRTLGPLVIPPTFSSLQLLANYDLPTKENCHTIGLIPNDIFGSDHYAMASEFVLMTR